MRRLRTLVLGSLPVLLIACGGDVKKRPDGATGETLDITAVSPDHGTLLGGTTVTISGSFLVGADDELHVLIGDMEATIEEHDEDEITVKTPAGNLAGSVSVTVFNRAGFGVEADSYSYNPMPTVTAIAPPAQESGMPVTITGTGFEVLEPGTNVVTLDGVECTDVAVEDDTSLTCTVGAMAPYKTSDVLVTNDNGTGTLASGFRMLANGLLIAESRRSGAPKLFFVDPEATTPEVREIGALNIGSFPVGIQSMTRRGQAVYGTTSHPGRLVTINNATAEITIVAPLMLDAAEQYMKDIVYVNGEVYGYGARNRTPGLKLINTATGAVTARGGPSNDYAIADDSVDGDDFALVGSYSGSEYSRINLTTGDTALAFTGLDANSGRIRGLTRYKGRLYAIRDGNGDGVAPGGGGGVKTLVRIDESGDTAGTHTTITTLAPFAHAMCEAPL